MTGIAKILLVTVALVAASTAQSPGEVEMTKRLEKKTLYLRGFPDADRVIYNDQGVPEQIFRRGSWTYGQIHVEKVAFSEATIEILGKRVGQTHDRGGWKQERTDEAQTLIIKTSPNMLTSETATKLLDAIFIFDQGEVPKTAPEEWFRTDPTGNPVVTYKTKVERISNEVEAPIPVESATSQESAATQSVDNTNPKFRGKVLLRVVVDAGGQVSVIKVESPIGMGLDEKAIEAVKSWKFKPAKKNGKPVPVAFALEVNFNLK